MLQKMKTMKKTNRLMACLTLVLLALPIATTNAEDILNAIPFQTQAGVTVEDEATFSIELVNTNEYQALQFIIELPKGMRLVIDNDDYDAIELSPERFPGKTRKGVFIPNHDVDFTSLTENSYMMNVYNSDFETISGTDGEAFICHFTTDTDMQPGYYPITLTNVVLAIDGVNGVYPPTSTSYVKVGNPENATLALTDYVPSFVNSALEEEQDLKTLDISRCTGMGGTFLLTEGRGLILPEEPFEIPTVAYSRNTSSKWGTICVPMPLTSDKKMQYYNFSELDGNVAVFTATDNVSAGTPTVFQILNGSELSVNNVNVMLSNTIEDVPGGLTLKGVYEEVQVDVDDASPAYYFKDNKFNRGAGFFTVPPFRAYFVAENASDIKQISIAIDEPTAIVIPMKGETNERSDSSLYSLTGAKVSVPSMGFYIIDGKKIIIR